MTELNAKTFVTPRELAESLGVGESSVKRWADEGRIQVGRTLGGHRRVPVAEAIRFIRESGLSVLYPDILGLPSLTGSNGTVGKSDGLESTESLFHRALMEGNGEEARRIVTAEFLSGRTVASIADGLIAGSMEKIGRLWRDNVDGIFVEHRASDICAQCVHALISRLPRPDVSSPYAIGAAPAHDMHALPSLLASAVLQETGFNSINLGPETPVDVMAIALRTYRPRLLWISATRSLSNDEAGELMRGIRGIARKACAWNGHVAVGGQGLPDSVRASRSRNLHVLESMTRLAEVAGSLLEKPVV